MILPPHDRRPAVTKCDNRLTILLNDRIARVHSHEWSRRAPGATSLSSSSLAGPTTADGTAECLRQTNLARCAHGVSGSRSPPTPPAPPDPNPCFLEKRVYQGSSGAVYPYPVVESVANEKAPRDYNAVFLENEYLKVMILPELGGRVQMALDKTNDYHFVYYNRVIKPALVGLAGPWISGGIEFNWPQHHRPSTFHPVDAAIDRQRRRLVDRLVQRDRPHGRHQGNARLDAASRQGVPRSRRSDCSIARRCRRHFSGGPIRRCTSTRIINRSFRPTSWR